MPSSHHHPTTSLPQFPQRTMGRQKGALCEAPRGLRGRCACVRELRACARLPARAIRAQDSRVHEQSRALSPGHLRPHPSAAPRAEPLLPYEEPGCTWGAHSRVYTRVCRRVITHPAAVGKAPPGRGLPRCSCWVTARPNDAMSLFAYAKQRLCSGVPREDALPPATRPLTGPWPGCHARTPQPALAPHVHRGPLH